MKFGLQNFPFNPEKGGAYTYEPSLLILGCSVCILLAGPGRYALQPRGKTEECLEAVHHMA